MVAERFLMCPPEHYDARHLFNPWMDWREAVDPARARDEWERLRAAVVAAGGEVLVIAPQPDAGAMVFTRDAALVHLPGQAVILRNDGPRGVVEPPLFSAWFACHGYALEAPPPGRIDGGNILRCHDGHYLIGIKPGSDLRAERYLARLLHRLTGTPCTGIPLADRRYLHLDMVLADLGGRGWLLHPAGLGSVDLRHPAWRAVFGKAPVIEVAEEEAGRLACNIITIGGMVIAGWLSDRLRRAITALGFEVVLTELEEFRKAGGGAHCLTLEIGPRPSAAGDESDQRKGGERDAEETTGSGDPSAHDG